MYRHVLNDKPLQMPPWPSLLLDLLARSRCWCSGPCCRAAIAAAPVLGGGGATEIDEIVTLPPDTGEEPPSPHDCWRRNRCWHSAELRARGQHARGPGQRKLNPDERVRLLPMETELLLPAGR